jgi:hypothetical protein
MSGPTDWAGYLKKQYGGIVEPLPEPNTMAEHLPFIPKDKQPGDTYEVNVNLSFEHGVTHDNTRGNYTYNSARDSVSLPARLRGSSISVIGQIPRDMVEALKTASQRNAPMSGMDSKLGLTMMGGNFYREVQLHYGPGPGSTALCNIGEVSTIVSGTNLGAGGPIVCDLKRASYSAGLWNEMGGGNALVDIYESDGLTLVAAEVSVDAVSHANNRLTLSKSGSAADVDATDLIMPRLSVGLSAVGLQGILENTGSLFELSAATYPQWQAKSFAISGALNRGDIMALGGVLAQNGLRAGGKLFCNANTFADLADELSDLQTFDSPNGRTSDTKEFGATTLRFKTPCGVIEVAEDLVMKQSIAMFIGNYNGSRRPCAERVGNRDLTMEQPNGEIVTKLEASSGMQVEAYTNQAPFIKIPYHCAILTGITNTGDTSPSA